MCDKSRKRSKRFDQYFRLILGRRIGSHSVGGRSRVGRGSVEGRSRVGRGSVDSRSRVGRLSDFPVKSL